MTNYESRHGKRLKWTTVKRNALYERLVEVFGPYNTWEKSYSPGKGLDEKFDQFCENFARTFGVNSANAVKTQINWSHPILNNGKCRSPGYVKTPGDRKSTIWMLFNMSAADDAGFINIKEDGIEFEVSMK